MTGLAGWGEFVAAYAAFFLSHSVPLRAPIRPWLAARLGAAGFTLLYSALSLAALGWLIVAAGRAPHVTLWPWAPWQNHAVLLLMAPACLILALAIARPNPFSFGGMHDHRFDPERPGPVRVTRHPLLLALALWAVAHLAPNGDLAHALVFGAFAAFALAGGRLIDRRRRRAMGARWDVLRRAVAAAPPLRRPGAGDALRLAAGAALYAALIGLHPHLFGVSPIP